MSSLKKLSYFVFCVVLASCAITKQTVAETSVIYDVDYFKSLKTDESWLTSERSSISFNKGDAKNCKDYLELSKNSVIEESSKNFLIKSEYLECEVLTLVKNSHAKTVDYKSAAELRSDFGATLSQRLDITSFNSSLGQLASDEKKTLAALFPSAITEDSNNLTIETDSRYFNLRLVAKTYLNNNQQEDWIVIVTDEILDGTYRNFDTIVINDPGTSEQSLLTAKSFMDIQNN